MYRRIAGRFICQCSTLLNITVTTIFRGTLIGANSFIMVDNFAAGKICVPEVGPSVFARVTAAMDWIVMNTKGEKPPPKNSNCEDIYNDDYCVVLDDVLIPYP